MTPERADELAKMAFGRDLRGGPAIFKSGVVEAILHACAEQRETDARICDTTAEFHGFYGTAAKDAAVKIRDGK